jgi:hypothetical protein
VVSGAKSEAWNDLDGAGRSGALVVRGLNWYDLETPSVDRLPNIWTGACPVLLDHLAHGEK